MKIHVPRMSVMGTKKNNGEKNRHILIYLTSLFPCTLQTFLMFLFQCTNFLFLESILYFMLEALLHHQVSLKKMMIVESFFLYIIALSIRRTNTLKVREHFFSYTIERNLIRVTGILLCQLCF